MKENKTFHYVTFSILVLAFIFIFVSFVFLRQSDNLAETLSIIAIDLVRVLLIVCSVILNYTIPRSKWKYTPLAFTVIIAAATVISCDFEKSLQYIKTFQILNISYIFIEVSFLLLANSFSIKEEQKEEDLIGKMKSKIVKMEQNELQMKSKIVEMEQNEKVMESLKDNITENENLINDLKDKAFLFEREIDRIKNATISNGHSYYILTFENNVFSLKTQNQNSKTKPPHITEILQ